MTKRFCDYCGGEIFGGHYMDKSVGQTRRLSGDIKVDGIFRKRGDLKLTIQVDADADMCFACVNTVLATGIKP